MTISNAVWGVGVSQKEDGRILDLAKASRIAAIGECMVELRETPEGSLTRGFGGDTLNAAIYLARLGTRVDYVTGLGTDAWSDAMAAAWAAEGVGVGQVRRIAGKEPGLYLITTDARGERKFRYWRDASAARVLFDQSDGADLTAQLAGYDLLYFSGITLSIYAPDARAKLMDAAARLRARGGHVAFDTNFRPAGWPDKGVAETAFRAAMAAADLVFASTEDLDLLYGAAGSSVFAAATAGCESVLKHPDLTCALSGYGTVSGSPAARVVDTTAAGDSFAAAYLAARLEGQNPREAALAGHRLAGIVVGYPGAIIPKEAMPPGP
jgi:2-dehydro-3-deoxygluconokinase